MSEEATIGASTVSPEVEAKRVLEAEKQARIELCRQGIEGILTQYNCMFDVTVILRANQVIPQIGIVAKENV